MFVSYTFHIPRTKNNNRVRAIKIQTPRADLSFWLKKKELICPMGYGRTRTGREGVWDRVAVTAARRDAGEIRPHTSGKVGVCVGTSALLRTNPATTPNKFRSSEVRAGRFC